MIIGYARVSTQDQNLKLQKDALKKAGCEKIITDKVSGIKDQRKGLDKLLGAIRKDDTVVVWKLDRLGRSLKHLIEFVSDLKNKGVHFKSLQENIDTTTGVGKLTFHLFASLAEFERDIIRERTMAGLAAARARGRVGGRPKALDEKQAQQLKTMYNDNNISIKDICSTLSIGRATLYRYLREIGVKVGRPENVGITTENKSIKKSIQLDLNLRVERNNKFVRGMKRARQEIEDYCLRQFNAKKLDKNGWDYTITVEFEDEKDLEKQINDLCADMESTADCRNCFTEASIYDPILDKSWY
ncbi:MAG: recombinase family protein [Bacteriovoracaceae bacterium]|nr:recombinase family protein [Bacteriovoracaceae bacterium]